jgi:hypothetical protein
MRRLRYSSKILAPMLLALVVCEPCVGSPVDTARAQWARDFKDACKGFDMQPDDPMYQLDPNPAVQSASMGSKTFVLFTFVRCGSSYVATAAYVVEGEHAVSVEIPLLGDARFLPSKIVSSSNEEIVFRGDGWYSVPEPGSGKGPTEGSGYAIDFTQSDPHCCPTLEQTLTYNFRTRQSSLKTLGLSAAGKVALRAKQKEQAAAQKADNERKMILAEIKAMCFKRWGTDYHMVRVCIEDQLESLRQIQRLGE